MMSGGPEAMLCCEIKSCCCRIRVLLPADLCSVSIAWKISNLPSMNCNRGISSLNPSPR